MSEIKVKVTYFKDAEKVLASSQEMRQHLDKLGFRVVGHAVPHVGVDTGALSASLGHRVEINDEGVAQAVMGSGAGAGVQPIYYASQHMAGKPDPTVSRPTQMKSRKKRDHPTKKAPTKPFKKAMDELGIKYTVKPGGFEA